MVWLLLWLLCGVVAAVIYSGKGRSGVAAFIIGVLLGPIGVILAAVTPADKAAQERKAVAGGDMKKCPNCAELVRRDANVCRYCSFAFAAAEPVSALTVDGKATKVQAAGGTVCSACSGFVRSDATFCKHCKHEFAQAAPV